MKGNNTSIFIAIVAVVIIAIVVMVFVWHPGNSGQPGAALSRIGGNGPALGSGVSSTLSATQAPVPANAVAPSEGSTSSVPAGVAVPVVQTPALPGSSASFRSFDISIKSNTYTPSTIIVNQGDTVNLEITAVDANYSFAQPNYGLSSTIAKGKTQRIQFQALQSGKFTFYCPSCGGPSKGPVGYLIVTSQ